jgi:hypothetical protein
VLVVVVVVEVMSLGVEAVVVLFASCAKAEVMIIICIVAESIKAELPHAISIKAIMNALRLPLYAKDASFLLFSFLLLLLLIDILQEILFHCSDLRDWRLFSATNLANFHSLCY